MRISLTAAWWVWKIDSPLRITINPSSVCPNEFYLYSRVYIYKYFCFLDTVNKVDISISGRCLYALAPVVLCSESGGAFGTPGLSYAEKKKMYKNTRPLRPRIFGYDARDYIANDRGTNSISTAFQFFLNYLILKKIFVHFYFNIRTLIGCG